MICNCGLKYKLFWSMVKMFGLNMTACSLIFQLGFLFIKGFCLTLIITSHGILKLTTSLANFNS